MAVETQETRHEEVEIKLTLARGSLKKLLECSAVKRHTVKGSAQKLRLVTVYYDTPLRALHEAGLAYRVRRTGKAYECTVKTGRKAAAGLSARGEYTVPTKNAKPVLTGFAEQGLDVDLPALVGGATLQPLFTVKVERRVRLLQITDRTLVELAVDQGAVLNEKSEDKIDEIELELKRGDVADLLKYVAQLAGVVPLFPENRSKYARGLALCGVVTAPREAKGLPWNPDQDLRGLLSDLFTGAGERLMAAQLALAKVKGKERSPEETLLPPLTELAQILRLVQPLVVGTSSLSTSVERMRVPLAQLAQRKQLLRLWQDVQDPLLGESKTDALSPLLALGIKRVSARMQEACKKGLATKLMYELWSVLYSARWKHEEYLTAEQFVKWRAQALLDVVLQQPTLPGGLNAERGVKAQESLTLLLWLHELSGEPDLGKKKLKRLREVQVELDAVVAAVSDYKELTGRHATAAYQRQRGFLEGYLARERALRLAKAVKGLKKLM